MGERFIDCGGVRIAVEEAGEGIPVVLAHGLTATRRYVVMGSRALERSGHRVLAYDARGHGASDPARAASDYGYGWLEADLLALLDEAGIERAVVAGASMGAHTALRAALRHGERIAAICAITPAFDPRAGAQPRDLERWDALAAGLRERGVEGFVEAYDLDAVPAALREQTERLLRQRLVRHAHPEAVADALEVVPRSRPFDSLDELGSLALPVTVVGSRDEADPGHPLDVAVAYAEAIPGARLLCEEEGESPLAWQGGALSRAIAALA